MCGIFGFIAPAGTPWDKGGMVRLITDLIRKSEPRGREAAGLVIISGGNAQVFKKAMRPDLFLKHPDFQTFIDDNLSVAANSDGKLKEPIAVIGHCRLVTNGAEIVPENNQPILAGGTVGIHNGIVTNDKALWRQNGNMAEMPESDSDILFRLIEKRCAAGAPLDGTVAEIMTALEGTASLALYNTATPALVLATNTGSLYYAKSSHAGALLFASERFILQAVLDGNTDLAGAGLEATRLLPGRGMLSAFADAEPVTFDLAQAPAAPAIKTAQSAAGIVQDRSERISDIKRCARCILPVTYPFIDIDASGVCNYCRDYAPPQLTGRAALEAELAKHRSSDGSRDCIVAFSGGRDSSYGLHLLKNEYDMNPVAYTYDWGMVTGIARRNQARICGKLGVEHILRAADIPRKRRYMRKNIQAWLRQPHLGMVPLFMAGDKFFYQIGRELRGETKIPLVIFCAGNPLERTDFKGGFAGVRESQHGQRLFAFSLANKLQIAAFYALQYAKNPAYLNESLLESIRSFFTTFVGKDDFLYLYHFIKWDEDEINRTLIGEYGWETAEHTENTWRIGDGYTTFINYCYYAIAGFSEFDTYRSQQIRAGLMTRDEALARVAVENVPDMPVLYEFASQVGLNLEEALTRINTAPKLY
jgi:hypothetical protein